MKTARLNEIIALQGRCSEKNYASQVGKIHKVLIEGPSKKNPDQLCGRAGNYMMCVFTANGYKAGDYVTVRVDAATPATLICSLVI